MALAIKESPNQPYDISLTSHVVIDSLICGISATLLRILAIIPTVDIYALTLDIYDKVIV